MEIPHGYSSLAGEFFLHVQFATDALHYGLVPRSGRNGFPNVAQLRNMDWDERNWARLHWYSKIKDKTACDFGVSTLELLTSQEQISDFVVEIAEDLEQISAASQW